MAEFSRTYLLWMISGTYTLICIVSVVVNALTYYYLFYVLVERDGEPVLEMIEKLAGAVDAGAEPPAEERQPHATQRLQRALNTLQACFLLGGPRRIMMRWATRNRCMPTPPRDRR